MMPEPLGPIARDSVDSRLSATGGRSGTAASLLTEHALLLTPRASVAPTEMAPGD
ncbi:hypothetical protein H4S06_003639, partial [Coemansia sp. BCRC 34490]